MPQGNPSPSHQPVLPVAWNVAQLPAEPGTASTIRERSLKLAFSTRSSPRSVLVRQMLKLVNAMPVPALLLAEGGKIITVNAKGRALLSRGQATWPWHHESRLWSALGWPAVPFHQWEWNGRLVSAWDYPLEQSLDSQSLTIRYVLEEPAPDHDSQQGRLSHLGQEVLRVVHDIRQPLTSLEWYAALLGKETESVDERKALIDHLVTTIRKFDGLLANLLAFAKPVQMETHRFRLSDLLDEVEWLAVYSLQQKQITIHRSIESGLVDVWGDEALLKRAVLNVVLNAIHASSPGGRIELICQRVACEESDSSSGSGGQGIQVLVRDYGCGMRQEEVEQMFNPFFSKRKGGTGLGLPIVKHIVQAHHGLIDVQSEQGTGTTVRLVLPQ